jgi:signal transduction histidine kinase
MIIVIALVLLLIFFYVVVLNRKKVRKLANELIVQNDKLTEAKISLENNQHELEAQQKDLRELNKSKDKFLSILSHDLKGPISGFNELLTTVDEQWGELPDEEKHHLTKLLKDSSGRTFVLLEDLLNWGKATNGQIKPELKIFNVKEVSLDVVKLFESKLSKKNIQLNLDIPDDFQLNNDARLFSQIIQNLINNAIKYTFPGGKIAIKAELIKGMKTICVSDNGIGIPKNIVPKLFNLDVNFNRRGTEDEKSSGMGLILCKEYANLMNVKITIESKENEGSKFFIV